MTIALSVLVVLGAISAVGAVWDPLRKRRHCVATPSSAQQARAQQILAYYEKVWDSTAQ
jgi:hypothetical protein